MIKCYNPIAVTTQVRKDGKLRLDFSKVIGTDLIRLPCGKCMACRLDYAKQWAIRGEKEKLLTKGKCYFITLTKNNENLEFNDLSIRELQLYIKRLRKAFAPHKIRYMACGEYGEKSQRAHYHIILYNMPEIQDLQPYKNHNNNQTYTSQKMDAIWQKGFTVIGQASFQSIAYVARYITKKINGKQSQEHYTSKVDGLIRQKEFMLMSRRPGIGHEYLKKYQTELLTDLTIPTEKGTMGIPKYYKRKLSEDPQMAKLIKEKSAKFQDDTWKNIDDTDVIAREKKFQEEKIKFFNNLHKNKKERI